MLKSKKYTFEDTPLSGVKEPEVTYMKPSNSIPFFSNLSPLDVDKVLVSGKTLTTIQEQTSLAAPLLADVVGISKSKYYDMLQYEALDPKTIDALADFATLWQKGLQAFDGDRNLLLEWLNMRNENLGAILPVSLLSTRTGRRTLEKAFLRIEYSVYG